MNQAGLPLSIAGAVVVGAAAFAIAVYAMAKRRNPTRAVLERQQAPVLLAIGFGLAVLGLLAIPSMAG